MSPDTPLSGIEWIPRNKAGALARLGLLTLGCLVRRYPARYEDRSAFAAFPDQELDRAVCLHGVVGATALKRFGGRRGVYEMTLQDCGESILSRPLVCRWFNMPYMQNVFMVGQELVVFGRPKVKGKLIVIDHPEYELLEEDEVSSLHMGRIVPVHPAGEGITPRSLRSLISRALKECELGELSMMGEDSSAAYRSIHFPESFQQLEDARARLALEECHAMQVVVQMRRRTWSGGRGIARLAKGDLVHRLMSRLPFEPTQSQRKVIEEIRCDLASEHRMNRLLQGDVGSGKTLVAMAAMLHVIDSGASAVLMAPTQILAEQHFRNFRQMLEPLGVPVIIRTASKKSAEMPLLEQGPSVIIGTHALLFEDSTPTEAGLVVIDEQHKFGVMQRARLLGLPGAPDALVMTATPIPRTLTQTVYGDLDVSVIDEKPAGRGEVRTVIRPAEKLPEVAAFFKDHLDSGRQAYIVYPLIEESEKLSAKAAAEEFGKWCKLLAPHSVGLLHGRTPAEEKEATMTAFRNGDLAALVSTTVIEVGVDVPNATLLLVENAERFGLAQLHQLRGRIGRGAQKSYCVLLHDPKAQGDAIEKLGVLGRTSDGFLVAEEDLRLRGPGNVVGTQQTGLPPLRLAELSLDGRIIAAAAETARATLVADPELTSPANARIAAFCRRVLDDESSKLG